MPLRAAGPSYNRGHMSGVMDNLIAPARMQIIANVAGPGLS